MMPVSDLLRNLGLDRYDINARLRPALFALLPAFMVLVVWYPNVWTFLGSVLAVISACGTTYLMAQIARRRGRLVERSMGDRAGRRHSAKLLTHVDGTIARETKGRYHAYLRERGLSISTPDEEQRDQGVALDRARSAVDWLLEHTRPNAKKSLLFDENIAYGFHRNLYGLKPVAIVIVLLSSAVNAALLALQPAEATVFWSGVSLEILLLVMLAAWVAVVTEDFVADASLAYAQKLLSQCEGQHKQPMGTSSSPRNPKSTGGKRA